MSDERDEVFWYDVVAILRANTRMEDEKQKHLVWKDNGERVTMEDKEKLLRIVKSTKSAPTYVEDDGNDDWYYDVHVLSLVASIVRPSIIPPRMKSRKNGTNAVDALSVHSKLVSPKHA